MEESGSFRKLYVEKCFAEAKTKAEKMIKTSLLLLKIESITLAWMSPETKVVQLKNYTCQN
jgi:predicted metalloendopeptidase